MLPIQKNEYSIGKIWDMMDEPSINLIKSLYDDTLIKFKDNTDCVTYLYSSFNDHPSWRQSAYYTKNEFDSIKQYVETQNDEKSEPHQQNKMCHTHLQEFSEKIGVDKDYFQNVVYRMLDNLAIKILEKEYNIKVKPEDFIHSAQLTWYTDGDFIKMHDDGPTDTRICALLIYLTPEEYYKIGSGGELVLKNRKNTIDIAYPTLGNYAVIDFTRNSPVHSVHKVVGDFNRFAYLNFIELKDNNVRP